MELKSNVNHLHFLLTESFPNVQISEKSNIKLGNYIEFIVKEQLECQIMIRKKDLENNMFNWLYSTNPLSKSPYLIERTSTIETFADNVKDIIDHKRFDIEYIKEATKKINELLSDKGKKVEFEYNGKKYTGVVTVTASDKYEIKADSNTIPNKDGSGYYKIFGRPKEELKFLD